MPPFESFRDAKSYYAMLAHETTHNADIRIIPHRCHLPWSSLVEGCRHLA
jgi:antirestriction protein ArdC